MENKHRRAAALEAAAIFFLACLYGFWPVPDVNEPYYVGKAIHFWNPDYFAQDPFLTSADSHYLFYAVFGFFSLFLKPAALVWFGRAAIWLFTSFGWQRLSSALLPRPGFSILTAAAFFFYIEHFHLAGEWVIGGVEGKGIAFPFLFWGLALFVRRRYTGAFILMGIASAFHVLVGGWGVLAALGSLALSAAGRKTRKETSGEPASGKGKELLIGLAAGGVISLAGLLPALALDRGASPEVQHQAHFIYVYERIAHHLVPSTLPWTFRVRFLLLTLVWLFFCRFKPNGSEEARAAWRRWNRFVAVSLAVAGAGLFWDYGIPLLVKAGLLTDGSVSADLLRFYWFRLSDWTVPAGVALGSCAAAAALGENAGFSVLGKKFFPVFLPLLFTGGIIFIAAKKLFLAHALAVARAATVSPFFPAAPKPVDAIALLAAILVFGICFLAIKRIGGAQKRTGAFSNAALAMVTAALALAMPAWGAAEMTAMKSGVLVPRSNPPKESISNGWLDVCRWAQENTPEESVFLVPRGYESWKWHARRAEIANWKEIPQDASSMVRWYALMEDLYTTGVKKGKSRWNDPLIAVLLAKGEKRIARQAEKYHIDYIVAEQPPYNIGSQPKVKERFDEMVEKHRVYQNQHFIVLKFEHENPQGE
ncbi:MAG: hypothetical protein IJG60_00690 [Thermoguttaceae bacterium]|nr:hypothetical protein [Thermoguttaceae bacterium]